MIDEWLDDDSKTNVCSANFLCNIHQEFYERVPESFLNIHDPSTDKMIQMVPGELRKRLITIGDHVPPPADSLERFLSRFEEVYTPDKLVGHKKLTAAAASHHQLAWIHPFLDGNGRVTRLFSYAYMKKVNLESMSLWAI